MRPRITKLAGLMLLAALMAIPADRSAPPKSASRSPELAKEFHEVRLRKLHLVRPDLIPYPIMFEVYS